MTSARPRNIKPTGRGRILSWRGGSIWIGRAEESTDFHAHHAIQIAFSLTPGALRFRSAGGDWEEYSAAIIRAHHRHAFLARGELVASIFVEPESREGQAIGERFRDGIASIAGVVSQSAIAMLAAAYTDQHADADLACCARAVIASLVATCPYPDVPVDARILRAIDLLHERLSEPIYLGDIADAVHLSPGRFRHLFVEQTGTRFRPFVLWLRLTSALSSYAAGASLTDASHSGGFADSAHFSRTFRRMFGASPVSIQPEQPFRSSQGSRHGLH